MHTLFYYHLTATLIHTLSFTLLFQLQDDAEERYQVSIPYVEYKQGNATEGGLHATVLHEKVFGEFTLLALLMVNEAFTAISHLSGAVGFSVYRRRMVEDDRHLEVIRRYVEYAVTAALLEVALYVLIGGKDFNLLLAIVLTNVIIQVLGYMLERTENVQRQVYLNISGFVLLLVPIVSFLSASALTSGFVAISVYYTVLYALFGVHSLLHAVNPSWRAFVDKDAGFLVLGVAAKECLTWMAAALQTERYVEQGVAVKSLADYLQVDLFLQWFPVGVCACLVWALYISSRVTISDSYDSI